MTGQANQNQTSRQNTRRKENNVIRLRQRIDSRSTAVKPAKPRTWGLQNLAMGLNAIAASINSSHHSLLPKHLMGQFARTSMIMVAPCLSRWPCGVLETAILLIEICPRRGQVDDGGNGYFLVGSVFAHKQRATQIALRRTKKNTCLFCQNLTKSLSFRN